MDTIPKRRLKVLVVIFVWLGLAGYSLVSLWPAQTRGINQYSYDLIGPGMTEADVIAVIGLLSGNYSTQLIAQETVRVVTINLIGSRRNLNSKDWIADEGHIRVYFFDDGTVCSADSAFVGEALTDRILHWLGCQ